MGISSLTAYSALPTEGQNDKSLPMNPLERRSLRPTEKGRDFLPITPRRLSWKPSSLRLPYLLFMAFLTIGLIAVIEALRRLSAREQGIAFFQYSTDINSSVFVGYNYVPTIVAVIYVMLWSFIDLDAKRLEPYFHFARSKDTPASVLFLDYQFENQFFVPFAACKRKHWTIAILSAVYLLIALLFPASQGGLLGIRQASVNGSVALNSSQGLLTPQEQASVLDGQYISQAAAIQLPQGANLPDWTTSNFSIAPFGSASDFDSINETWSADNNFLAWAEPTCVPLVTPTILPSLCIGGEECFDAFAGQTGQISYLNFSGLSPPDGTECSFNATMTVILSQQDSLSSGNETGATLEYLPLWIQVGSSNVSLLQDQVQGFGVDGDCPTFPFFAAIIQLGTVPNDATSNLSTNATISSSGSTWAQLTYADNSWNWTVSAFACRTDYFSSSGQTTITNSASTASVSNSSHKSPLTSERFNIEAFESSLFQNASAITATPQALTWNSPATIAAANSTNLGELVEGTGFGQGVEQTLQLLFALAFRNCYDTAASPGNISGFQVRQGFAISTTYAFAVLSEVLLAISLGTIIFTIFRYRVRRNQLCSDPDSLAAQFSLVADLFDNFDALDAPSGHLDKASTVRLLARTRSIWLHRNRVGGTTFESHPEDLQNLSDDEEVSTSVDSLPFFLSRAGWSMGFLTLVAAFVVMMVLFIESIQAGGFTYLADSNSFLSQLLYSFLPTLVATLIEPGWTSIHRDLSLLEPWVMLRKGNALAKDTLSLRYSARPPMIVLPLALSRRHFVLAWVSLMCISSSILNIAMSGLFSQEFSAQELPLPVTSEYAQNNFAPQFNASMILTSGTLPEDMSPIFNIIQSNLGYAADLPPWTDEYYAYMPIGLQYQDSSFIYMSGSTIGITARLDCQPFPLTANATYGGYGTQVGPLGFQAFWNSSMPESDIEDTYADMKPLMGTNITFPCQVTFPFSSLQEQNAFNSTAYYWPDNPNTPNFDTVFPSLSNVSSEVDANSTLCAGTSFLLWSTVITPQVSTAVVCKPRVEIVDADILYTAGGHILDSEIASEISPSTNASLIERDAFMFAFANSFGGAAMQSFLSSGRYRYDWPGLLTNTLMASNASLAVKPADEDASSYLAAAGEDVYSRLFAAFFSHYRDEILAKPNSTFPVPALGKQGFSLVDGHTVAEGNTTTLLPSLPGTVLILQARMVPSSQLFLLTLSLLAFYILTAIMIIFARGRRYTGPRIPKSLGSIIPWIIHSQMLKEFEGMHYLGSTERNAILEGMGKTYGFGNFNDANGQARLGVEEEPLLHDSELI